jgi:hypothetical protein
MSTPTYDGKGQPIAGTGWLSGLTAWWHSLTPQYVTRAPRVIASKAHSDMSSMITGSSLGAPSGALSAPRDSLAIAPTVNGSGPHAPSIAKP